MLVHCINYPIQNYAFYVVVVDSIFGRGKVTGPSDKVNELFHTFFDKKHLVHFINNQAENT